MERPTFHELLTRADDETLQHLVGTPAIRLLSALDPQLSTPVNLRRTCLRLHTPAALLSDPESRSLILSLLRPEHAVALSLALGLGRENPYVALQALQIRRNSVRQRKLLAFFGIPAPDSETKRQPESVTDTVPRYQLFDHQRLAQRRATEALKLPDRRVVLHMPTGAGKTRTALHIVSSELRRREPTLVVWLAYSEELCDQAAVEFEYAWSYLGDRRVNIYRFWGSNRDIEIDNINDGLMIAGLSKTYERAKRDGEFIARLADRTTFVVIDEAHQAIAHTYRFVLDYFVGRNDQTSLLGLTATPGRTWNDPSVDEQLSTFFCHKKSRLAFLDIPAL